MINFRFSKKKQFFLLIFVSFITLYLTNSSGISSFRKINSYKEVQDIFDQCDNNTLITFDVDDTLFTALDFIARDLEHSIWFKISVAIKYPWLIFNKKKIEWIGSTVVQKARRLVFDPDIVGIIKQLQKRGCSIVALTAMETGSVGVIESLPKWRAKMLKDLGFDFSGRFQDTSFKKFNSYKKQFPCIYSGILCTNKESKGDVLAAFLDYYNLKPDKIISFDDLNYTLGSISKECKRRKINFQGYQILGAKKIPGKWSTKRAILQLDYLIKHNQWLSDTEADDLLYKPCFS